MFISMNFYTYISYCIVIKKIKYIITWHFLKEKCAPDDFALVCGDLDIGNFSSAI